MLIPRGDHDVKVLSSSITCVPKADLTWSRDIFGNEVALARFSEASDRLTITSELLVDLTAPAWPVFAITPLAHSHPFAYDADDEADLGALLRPQYPDPERIMASYAQGFVAAGPTDTLSLLKSVNIEVNTRTAYRTRDEEGTQSPLETLALASGSCRDIAALFLDVVRTLGFAARAVSGYLYDPLAASGDAGSTHAWAEVYLPGAGWIAFDPTHQRLGSSGLLPVAYGRSSGRIMPVTGGYIGNAADFAAMEVEVSVLPVREPGPGEMPFG
jgi:transglutaminase-like putative cysteine protease